MGIGELATLKWKVCMLPVSLRDKVVDEYKSTTKEGLCVEEQHKNPPECICRVFCSLHFISVCKSRTVSVYASGEQIYCTYCKGFKKKVVLLVGAG